MQGLAKRCQLPDMPIVAPSLGGEKGVGKKLFSHNLESRAGRYGVALFCVGAAVVARWVWDPVLNPNFAFLPFYVAVLVSGLICGWKPGLLALGLSAFAADFIFISFGSKPPTTDEKYSVRMAIFLSVSGLAVGLGEMQRRARLRAEKVVRQLRQEVQLHQKTESKLAESEASYRSLFENNIDIVFTLDLAGYFVTANNTALKLSGYSLPELRQLDFAALCPASEVAEARRQFEMAARGVPEPCFEVRVINKLGRQVDLLVTGGPVKVKGETVGVFGIASDITERKRAQMQVAAFSKLGQRLSSVTTPVEAGRMIGDAADELFDWDAFNLNLYSHETGQADYVLNVNNLDGQKVEVLPFAINGGVQALARRVLANGPQLILDPDEAGRLEPFMHSRLSPASLMFAPIRDQANIIGVLSVHSGLANAYTEQDLQALQALADYCGGALQRIYAEDGLRRREEENRRLNTDLETRVEERTRQLRAANDELEAFAYSVSHDLRAPLRGMSGFASALKHEYEKCLDATGMDYLQRVIDSSREMDGLIEDLLHLSRLTIGDMKRQPVNLSALAEGVLAHLRAAEPHRVVKCKITEGLTAQGDSRLMRVALENLLNNAWKFTKRQVNAMIEFGAMTQQNSLAFFVRDNGAGFDMAFADRLFGAFQRLHTASEFPGHGIGLATVQRIIHRHGGKIWASAEVNRGATFYFTLPN